MKRKQYQVVLSRGGAVVEHDLAYAHNSGVRKSEALARAYARSHGIILHGDKPTRDEVGYTRMWRSLDGSHELVADVVPITET